MLSLYLSHKRQLNLLIFSYLTLFSLQVRPCKQIQFPKPPRKQNKYFIQFSVKWKFIFFFNRFLTQLGRIERRNYLYPSSFPFPTPPHPRHVIANSLITRMSYFFQEFFVSPADVIFNVVWHVNIRPVIRVNTGMLDLQQQTTSFSVFYPVYFVYTNKPNVPCWPIPEVLHFGCAKGPGDNWASKTPRGSDVFCKFNMRYFWHSTNIMFFTEASNLDDFRFWKRLCPDPNQFTLKNVSR